MPRIPHVTVTPPPPPPPPSPFLSSPPPHHPYHPHLLTVPETIDNDLHHQQQWDYLHDQQLSQNTLDVSNPVFNIKRKRVRFKLDSDEEAPMTAKTTELTKQNIHTNKRKEFATILRHSGLETGTVSVKSTNVATKDDVRETSMVSGQHNQRSSRSSRMAHGHFSSFRDSIFKCGLASTKTTDISKCKEKGVSEVSHQDVHCTLRCSRRIHRNTSIPKDNCPCGRDLLTPVNGVSTKSEEKRTIKVSLPTTECPTKDVGNVSTLREGHCESGVVSTHIMDVRKQDQVSSSGQDSHNHNQCASRCLTKTLGNVSEEMETQSSSLTQRPVPATGQRDNNSSTNNNSLSSDSRTRICFEDLAPTRHTTWPDTVRTFVNDQRDVAEKTSSASSAFKPTVDLTNRINTRQCRRPLISRSQASKMQEQSNDRGEKLVNRSLYSAASKENDCIHYSHNVTAPARSSSSNESSHTHNTENSQHVQSQRECKSWSSKIPRCQIRAQSHDLLFQRTLCSTTCLIKSSRYSNVSIESQHLMNDGSVQLARGPTAICGKNISMVFYTDCRCAEGFRPREVKTSGSLSGNSAHGFLGGRGLKATTVSSDSVTGVPQCVNSIHDDHLVLSTAVCLNKMDFRRLMPQGVRDVDTTTRDKGCQPAYEKLYRLTAVTSPDPATQALRNELQASRAPFQPTQRRPLTPEDVPETSLVRCRPVLSRPTTAHGSRPTTAQGSRYILIPDAAGRQRPRSTPVHGLRTPHSSQLHVTGFSPLPPSSPHPGTPRVDPGNFDTLSPRILSKLLNDVQPRPFSATYGDRILTRAERTPRWKRERKEPKVNLNDDLSTTSGIESDVGIDDEVEDDDDVSDDDGDNDDSSDSEDGGFEPSLEDIRQQMPHPQDLFRLRPEKLDAIYVPEDKRDMRRFDFDATKVDVPPYEFKCPLPEPLNKVSLRLCAREGTYWQDYLRNPPTIGESTKDMMDRLVELERYQIVTEEWEAKKLKGQMRRQEKLALNGNASGSRATSAKVRDKRCCGLCLQAACVGDCPEKRLVTGRCEKCRQPLCTGACQDSRYEQRMRHTRSSDNLILDEPPPPPLPRSPSRGCYSCLRRHNAKIINANNLLMGRPKSSNATYARGKSSCRPRDLRPTSAAALHSSLVRDFERLGIEPQQPTPPPKTSNLRPRSRNGLLPGKSSRSNRKNSISDSGRKMRRGRHGRQSAKASS